MTKEQCRHRVVGVGILPAVRAASAEQALQAVDAVCAGGIPIIEITMTVPRAIEVISELARRKASEVLIGAGTVLDAFTAQRY